LSSKQSSRIFVAVHSGGICVQPWAAIIIGVTAGAVYVSASGLMSHAFKIDDPLDAVAVHAFCGMWGLVMAACFSIISTTSTLT
jgi:Amt family ammonium transporter